MEVSTTNYWRKLLKKSVFFLWQRTALFKWDDIDISPIIIQVNSVSRSAFWDLSAKWHRIPHTDTRRTNKQKKKTHNTHTHTNTHTETCSIWATEQTDRTDHNLQWEQQVWTRGGGWRLGVGVWGSVGVHWGGEMAHGSLQIVMFLWRCPYTVLLASGSSHGDNVSLIQVSDQLHSQDTDFQMSASAEKCWLSPPKFAFLGWRV